MVMERICKNCANFKPSFFYLFRKMGYCGHDDVFVGAGDPCDFDSGDFAKMYRFIPKPTTPDNKQQKVK